MLIDSHAHLNFEGFKDTLDFSDLSGVINVGTNLSDSKDAIKLAQAHKNIYASVGIHPHETCDDWETFGKLAQEPKVVAIGECGLDFSRSKDFDSQKEMFSRQIGIAKKLDLPLILHIRDAQEELISNFGHDLTSLQGVFHCFSGDENYLNTILKLMPEFYTSFAGNITFKNAHSLRELVKLVPLDRILIETDAPFLTPEPYRGARNEPKNVKITAEKVASLKEVSFQEIEEQTSANAKKLFKL